MDQEKIEALIEQATVNCYDKHEQFWGMLTALQEQLRFPFPAFASGEFVAVVGIDEGHSNERRGIMVIMQKDGDDYSFPLSELQVRGDDEHNAAWIAAYRYWRR